MTLKSFRQDGLSFTEDGMPISLDEFGQSLNDYRHTFKFVKKIEHCSDPMLESFEYLFDTSVRIEEQDVPTEL